MSKFSVHACMTLIAMYRRPAKARPEPGTPLRVVEVAIRPSERTSLINEAVESALNRQKERDHHWEDQVDVSAIMVN